MLRKCILPLFLLLQVSAQAQTDERSAVIAVIQRMFDGMRAADSSAVRSVFDPSARLQSVFTNKEGQPVLATETIDEFVGAVGTPHKEVWDERIWTYDVNLDGPMATAWTEYTFFLDNKMLHCGVNAFHLFKGPQGWKITQITDTRHKQGCQTAPDADEAAINRLMDDWHHAAAVADEDAFFGSMAPDGIYLGTDATERWLRDDMREWSKKYFERESAWAFTAHDRRVYFSADGQLAWFEELLDTWMGLCRGSGVLKKSNEGWKISHYNLAVTVPNDLIKGFVELVKKAPEKKD